MLKWTISVREPKPDQEIQNTFLREKGYEFLHAVDFFPVIEGDPIACGILLIYRRLVDSVVVGEVCISHKSAASYVDQDFVNRYFPALATVLSTIQRIPVPTELWGELSIGHGDPSRQYEIPTLSSLSA
jgi:hypothetical protein